MTPKVYCKSRSPFVSVFCFSCSRAMSHVSVKSLGVDVGDVVFRLLSEPQKQRKWFIPK